MQATPSAPGAQDIRLPVQSEDATAVLRTWLKHTGDPVVKNEPVAELETDKVMVEVFAPCDGVLEVIAAENSAVEPDTVLGRVAPQTPIAQAPMPAQTSTTVSAIAPPDPPSPAGQTDEPRLSPAVRRLVAEHAIDPAQIPGTGRGGRLTREDVLKAIASQAHADAAVEGGVNHIPHSPIRRRIAQHMVQSLATAPHVTAVFEADLGAILRHRQAHKERFAQQGMHLTLTAYFISAAASAMAAAPQVNSRWREEDLEVYTDVNIGVGTALGDQGLIVPVIHQAQNLSLSGIASQLQTLTQAARRGTLKPQDVQNGTFTISNYGGSGALWAAPIIIHQPQSAILGIGALQKRVVVTEVQGAESLQIRPMAYVSLTIDHRVLDGEQANAWLAHFVKTLQTWT